MASSNKDKRNFLMLSSKEGKSNSKTLSSNKDKESFLRLSSNKDKRNFQMPNSNEDKISSPRTKAYRDKVNHLILNDFKIYEGKALMINCQLASERRCCSYD